MFSMDELENAKVSQDEVVSILKKNLGVTFTISVNNQEYSITSNNISAIIKIKTKDIYGYFVEVKFTCIDEVYESGIDIANIYKSAYEIQGLCNRYINMVYSNQVEIEISKGDLS